MKFLRTALLNGLYVLLPLMLLWIGLREIGGLLADMAAPLADMIPGHYLENLKLPGVVAIILIAGTSMLIGLLAYLPPVAYLARKFESSILFRVPMYKMLKVICSALVKSEESSVSPALVRDGEGGGDPCYVMEEHEGGLATVLLPWSPASFAGSIKIVSISRLQYLDCTIDEYSRSISLMGVGVEECLTKTATMPDERLE